MDYIQSLVHSGFTRRQAEAQVMVLENYIKKLTTKEDLDGGLNSVRGEMRELRLELEKLKSEVAQLKKDFAELQTKVDQLKVEIKELRLMIHQMTYRIILSTAGLMTALAVIFRFLSGT